MGAACSPAITTHSFASPMLRTPISLVAGSRRTEEREADYPRREQGGHGACVGSGRGREAAVGEVHQQGRTIGRHSVGFGGGWRSYLRGERLSRSEKSRSKRRIDSARSREQGRCLESLSSSMWGTKALQAGSVRRRHGDPWRSVFGHHGRATTSLFCL